MEEQLRHFPNAVWSTYGMTETLSHIALRRLSGPNASQWYAPLPSVDVTLSSEGCLVINAPQVCSERLTTNDLAEIRPDGSFRILGRKDNVICSGGIKIQIEDVEQLLKPHIHSPFLITKRKDVKLGEAVVLLTEGDINEAKEACQQLLPRHWQPRHYQQVTHIPLTETGKPARQIAEKIAEKG
jgi:O-succinylbenzoic acid--CoA ligase